MLSLGEFVELVFMAFGTQIFIREYDTVYIFWAVVVLSVAY
jgi:hypothetical protein